MYCFNAIIWLAGGFRWEETLWHLLVQINCCFSEDEEFYIIWSLLKSLACPKSVYKLPMLYNHMEFFYQGRYNEDDEKHTYKVKLSDFKVRVAKKYQLQLSVILV